MATHQSIPKPANAKKKSDILPIPAQSKPHPVIAQPKIESTRSNEEQLAQMRAKREASERLGSTLLTPQSLPHAPPPLQPKLTIGQSGDMYEQEADRVARQVVDQINAPPKIQADNTLEKAKAILQQAGEVTQNQIEALEDFIRGVFRSQTQDIDPNDPERDGSRDRKLSNGEIKRLKDAGEDIHELKRDCEGGASKCDLYKDRDGNIYVKPKGGRGAGDFTGLNINDF